MAMLTVRLSCSAPTSDEIFAVASDVEKEMAGKPLNAETAFAFTEEVKRRVADMIQVTVLNPVVKEK
jgi:predicted protein tyrosine phosphatase